MAATVETACGPASSEEADIREAESKDRQASGG